MLHTEIGAHLKAATDLPRLNAELRSANEDGDALLVQTGLAPTAACVTARPNVGARQAITKLSNQYERLTQAKQSADEQLSTARRDLEALAREPAAPTSVDDVSGLRAALAAARRLGDIDTLIEDRVARLANEHQQTKVRASAMPLCTATLDELISPPLPAEETLTRFDSAFDELEDRKRTLAADQERIKAERASLSLRVEGLELTGAVPSEADLADARASREQQWVEVRDILTDPANASPADSGEIADTFETRVLTTDEIAGPAPPRSRPRRPTRGTLRRDELVRSHARRAQQAPGPAADRDRRSPAAMGSDLGCREDHPVGSAGNAGLAARPLAAGCRQRQTGS